MKKLAIFLVSIILAIIILPNIWTSKADGADAFQVIPDEAIRLRILANSDGKEDQRIKQKVRDRVSEEIAEWVKEIDDIEEARKLIAERLNDVEKIIAAVFAEEGYQQPFKAEYSKRVQFPAKMYGSYVYPAGEYEAVLITIGEGEGANWWCVLFPPLCFLDFSFGATVGDDETAAKPETEKVEVKFFLWEWLGLS